ncbi:MULTISPECIES: asparaginase domain-containing protein [Marinobacter]|uniref:asparaginase domain-containing protein n=1 Tax=Marinobacter TaxID=2742 RepID=UPI000DAB765B|nr:MULTISPECIES: asparaginase domain-containing protein [Marinobacter]
MTDNGLLVLTTGGTIDKIYFDAKSEFSIGDSEFADIAALAQVSMPYRVESVMRKDSLDMTDADRQAIRAAVEAAPERRILITHGTDTMVDTARVLADLPDRIIVLTGAMQPSRMRVTDAPFNVGFALGALQSLASGVYIAMSGQILNPHHARKNRAAGRFEAE